MKNTKNKILFTALELFNHKGYFNVTIRMIAEKSKMSPGNLNYHYQRKEDILESLYFDMVSKFDERVEKLELLGISLPAVAIQIHSSMERMLTFSFIWTDLYNLLRVSDKIKAHFNKAYTDRYMGCQRLFDALHKQELMRGPEYHNEFELLAQRFISLSNTWIYHSNLYEKKIDQHFIVSQVINLLSELYPYFSSKGKEKYRELLQQGWK